MDGQRDGRRLLLTSGCWQCQAMRLMLVHREENIVIFWIYIYMYTGWCICLHLPWADAVSGSIRLGFLPVQREKHVIVIWIDVHMHTDSGS
jgi:hypothetical protein